MFSHTELLCKHCSWPTRDRIGHLVALCFVIHCATVDCSLSNFSGGSLACIRTVSNVIPKKVSDVAGPSSLSSASGTPSKLQMCSTVV